MNYSVAVRLYSEIRHHGSHGPKTHAVRSAVASKARGLLKKKQEESSGSEVATDETTKASERKASKAYGTHGGNVHVQTLYSKGNVTVDDADRLLRYLDNLTSKFEAMNSFDIKAAKNKYSCAKAEVLDRFHAQFGEDLSEKNATLALKELAQHSFDYAQHQIVVIISSDESFEGSRPDGQGRYIRELRSKRIYSKGRTLIPAEIRDQLKNVSKDELKLTRSALLGKGARIVVNTKTGRKELQIDFGQLGSRVYEVDSY